MVKGRLRLRRLSNFLAILAILAFFYSSACAEDKPSLDILSLKRNFVNLMNRWVSFRWGLNCVIYVLYYDPSIVGPWVELNAKLNGWSDVEKEEFRRNVEDALKVGRATAFLITVENVGKEAISLSPLAEKIVLEDSNGNEYKVVSYENHLDSPISDKAQGLIFFPLIPKGVGELKLKIVGLPDGDALFSWSLEVKDREVAQEKKSELTWEQISSTKPNQPKPEGKKVEVKVVKPEGQIKTVIKPNPPSPPSSPSKPSNPPSKNEDSKNKGDGKDKVKEEKVPVNVVSSEKEGKDTFLLADDVEKAKVLDPMEVLKEYLEAWGREDYGKMYSLLSSATKAKLSFPEFKKVVEGEIPSWVKSGNYRLLPPKKTDKGVYISLISTVRLGFIKIVDTKSFSLVLDKEGWRIQL